MVSRAAAILGENFVGAYLQGSFAVGDADINSDCDFLVPVNCPITSRQEVRLRELHREIPTWEGYWTRHLEGSYPNVRELRALDGLGKRWLYVDHGAREMEWSTHCNTEVVRWSLRERGVTLAGPDPRSLVDEVPPAALRDRARQDAEDFLPGLETWLPLDVAWAQRYAVAMFCRILYTLETGGVTSKQAALLWAQEHLDPTWSGLFQQVLDDRVRGFDPDEAAPPGSVAHTLAFAEYAKAIARMSGEGA